MSERSDTTTMFSEVDYDVVITGGGLAGLCLAKQLRGAHPSLSVLICERVSSPLPVSAFKVGESTVEVGAYYLSEVIGLRDYLNSTHLEKLGLRYFYGESDDLPSEPEFGVSEFLPAKSYQLDRGSLEEHLRKVVVAAGATLLQGVQVLDIVLGAGNEPHSVLYQPRDATSDSPATVTCRWVIDATGRRRLLQRKLGLTKQFSKRHNAVWFRLAGRIDIDAAIDPACRSWHDRVSGPRWNSTNHFMFEGGWIWIIPLSANHTSVGIVVADKVQGSIERFNRIERALDFIAGRVPAIEKAMRSLDVLDFHVLKNYSHSSHQAFSANRWACVGDAVAFADPYYSVGSNLIAYANGLVTKMIEKDLQGILADDFVSYANRWFLSLAESLTNNIQLAYPFHHRPALMALKTIWDYYVGWSFSDPQYYDGTYLSAPAGTTLSGLGIRVVSAQARVMDLLADWAPRYRGSLRFDYIDYYRDLPTLARLFVQNLPAGEPRSFATLMASIRDGLDRIEELAHIIFYLAIEDTLPEHLPEVRSHGWLNVAAISLDPSRWRDDGLFDPKTRSRPDQLSTLERELRGLLTVSRRPLAGPSQRTLVRS
jgi:flavin-dependent dehydrogenase